MGGDVACAGGDDEANDAETERRDGMEAPLLGFIRVAR